MFINHLRTWCFLSNSGYLFILYTFHQVAINLNMSFTALLFDTLTRNLAEFIYFKLDDNRFLCLKAEFKSVTCNRHAFDRLLLSRTNACKSFMCVDINWFSLSYGYTLYTKANFKLNAINLLIGQAFESINLLSIPLSELYCGNIMVDW